MSNEQPILKNVQLNLIRRDGGTQMRVEVDQKAVEEYAEQMKAGAKFPPLTLFDDSKNKWLADGFHRIAAWELAEMGMTIPCEIYAGEREDAIVYGIKAEHILKTRAATALYAYAERIIGRQVFVFPNISEFGCRAVSQRYGC